MAYIDSHAHICAPQLADDLAEIIAGFKLNDIGRVMIICCDNQDYQKALLLQKQYRFFDIAKGIHPEVANEYEEKDLTELEEQLKSQNIVLVGEIGLDYYWIKNNKEKQQDLFLYQLALADRYNLPISVHSRDAAQDTYELLKNHHRLKSGVLHCYSGSVEMMERYLQLGYYISLAGPVTFNNAKTTKEVAMALPLERLLYETDCPYLTPVPFRGKRNDPNYVRYTALKIAELKTISVESLNQQVTLNYERLLSR